MVWGCAYGLDIIVRLFFVTFSTVNLSHFLTSMYRQWVPCKRNSSNNFISIFLKLCTCFLHGLKMCMWFEYNPCVDFSHFANFVIFWPRILWKCIDSECLVSATPHTILYQSFWNFAHVFAMVWRCACGLDIILELIFVTFSTLWTLSFSDSPHWVPCKHNSLCNFMPILMQLCTSFFPCLKMCMWFGFNPAVNYFHFSTLLTLSFFAGATSASPKFDLYLALKPYLVGTISPKPLKLGPSYSVYWLGMRYRLPDYFLCKFRKIDREMALGKFWQFLTSVRGIICSSHV